MNAERDARARTRNASGSQVKPARKNAKGCPICGKPVLEEFKPFCSKRCADIDLGRWLGGRYAVPGEPVSPNDIPDSERDD